MQLPIQKIKSFLETAQINISYLFDKNSSIKGFNRPRLIKHSLIAAINLIILISILTFGHKPINNLISPFIESKQLTPLTQSKGFYEVMGFAPHWTFNKLDNVDFKTLTTLAYFSITAGSDGNLITDDPGYETFKSEAATRLFKKAHDNGTRVVLTITQMKNDPIKTIMDDPEAQNRVISQTIQEVKNRGIDGVNIDFEYSGNPGDAYRNKFSQFVADFNHRLHQELPNSKLTISVYASAVKDPKIYDISSIAKNSDGIFMMAYDFAIASSDNAIPTAPLYGHKEGKYWYDISTAVEDFLTQMPADKLILGVPYYGYNWLIYDEPKVKAETRPNYSWRGKARAQTYTIVTNDIHPSMEGISAYTDGWDDFGKVGWKAYYVNDTRTWRMVFFDDERSLSLKYDFAKDKGLQGVGLWALGFDNGKQELWDLLSSKFAGQLAKASLTQR